MDVEDAVQHVFDDAGVEGRTHAMDIDAGTGRLAEVGVLADDAVVTASVFKVPVLVELCRRAGTGEFALTDRFRVRAGERTMGPTGLSVMLDAADLSLRDVAYLMMSVSDNHATDALLGFLGRDSVNATMRRLGLGRTVLEGDCGYLFRTMAEDLGLASYDEIDRDGPPSQGVLDRLRTARALTPETSNRSTPRESTRLLAAIWRDEAIDPAGCAEVRRLMALQVAPHRLTSGFPNDDVAISGKTGTLRHVRNEIGVVEYPDGGRYAVAVFLRLPGPELRNPRADAAIGRAARVAVEHLRAVRGLPALAD